MLGSFKVNLATSFSGHVVFKSLSVLVCFLRILCDLSGFWVRIYFSAVVAVVTLFDQRAAPVM